MGSERGSKPGSLERRYEALSDERKNRYYLFRRHLGMTRQEVDALPWWETRFLVEKMNEEFSPPDEDSMDGPREGDRHFDDIAELGLQIHSI